MTALVVQDINPRVQYIANANQTVFTFNYLAFAPSDIDVYYVPAGTTPSDVSDILTYNLDYTVTLNPQPAVGGSITLLTAANAGDIVTIVRAQLDQRLNYYIDGGLFTATMVNTDFDQEVLMIQQNSMYNTAITPHYNLSDSPDPVIDIYLPLLPPNSVWVKNSNNTAIVAQAITAANVLPIQVPTQVGGFARFADTVGTLQTEQWIDDQSVSTQMFAGQNYITVSPGGTLTLALPHTAAIGTQITVIGYTATGWVITQYANQRVIWNGQQTTLGTGGSLASATSLSNVTLRCVVPNLIWVATAWSGSLVVT